MADLSEHFAYHRSQEEDEDVENWEFWLNAWGEDDE